MASPSHPTRCTAFRLAGLALAAALIASSAPGSALAIDGPLETTPLLAEKLVVPRYGNHPYAIYALSPWDGAGVQTVHASTDLGASWTPILGVGAPQSARGRIGTIALGSYGPLQAADGYRILEHRGDFSTPEWAEVSRVPGPWLPDFGGEYLDFLCATSTRRWLAFTSADPTSLYVTDPGDVPVWTALPFAGIPEPPGAYVTELAVADTGPWRILAAVQGPAGGVYSSADGGRTWERLGLHGRDVFDVAFQDGSSRIVYAATGDALYRSTDGGVTWTALAGPRAPEEQWILDVQASSLGDVLVDVELGHSGDRRALFAGRDNGSTFEEIALGPPVGQPEAMATHGAGLSLYVAGDRGVGRFWMGDTRRLFGPSRFETAARVSQHMCPAAQSADAVVLATSHDFPDAIAAAPLATLVGAPVLLAHASLPLSDTTRNEIMRVLEPGGTAYLMGGADVVPASVATELQALGYKVVRVAGPTRYETAVAVANRLPDPEAVFVAVGTDFPDALCAAPPASADEAPVLFTRTEALPASVRTYLVQHPSIEHAYIVGDTSVVSSSVEDELRSLVGDVERLGGQTRYDTSDEVAERFYAGDPAALGVATGADFPDALAGTVLCSQKDGPMLLSPPAPLILFAQGYDGYDGFSWNVKEYLDAHDPADIFVLGGPDVVPETAAEGMEREWSRGRW